MYLPFTVVLEGCKSKGSSHKDLRPSIRTSFEYAYRSGKCLAHNTVREPRFVFLKGLCVSTQGKNNAPELLHYYTILLLCFVIGTAFSETSALLYQTVRCHFTEESTVNISHILWHAVTRNAGRILCVRCEDPSFRDI